MSSPRATLTRLAALWLAALAACPLAPGRTLTASDGRTIEAEVLGFDGLDKVKIKRADTEQVFTLPISSFAEKDREALLAEARAEAAKPPPPPGDKDIVVELSRKTKSAKTIKWPVVTEYTDGTRRQIGTVNVTNVDSSYAVTLVNRTKSAIPNLRVDYVLFTESDTRRAGQPKPALAQQTGRATIEELPAHARVSVDTVPIPTRKTTLSGQASWVDAGVSHAPIELKGIWLRVYQGEVLVLESATPTTLAADNPWPVINTASSPSAPLSPFR